MLASRNMRNAKSTLRPQERPRNELQKTHGAGMSGSLVVCHKATVVVLRCERGENQVPVSNRH